MKRCWSSRAGPAPGAAAEASGVHHEGAVAATRDEASGSARWPPTDALALDGVLSAARLSPSVCALVPRLGGESLEDPGEVEDDVRAGVPGAERGAAALGVLKPVPAAEVQALPPAD